MGCGPSIIDPRECHATFTAVGFRQFRAAPVSIFGRGDWQQTLIREAREEFFDLADRLHRMADLAKRRTKGRGRSDRGTWTTAQRPLTDPCLFCRRDQNPMPHTSGRSGGGWEVTRDAARPRLGQARHRQAPTHRRSMKCPGPGNPKLFPPDVLGTGAGGGTPPAGGWRPH
jgi:hypothetical protein